MSTYSEKMMKRLHYLEDIADINKKSKSVIIVDESDDVIFADLEAFYNKISGANTKVFCLTATAHDGKEKGSEKTALELLGFETHRNSKAGELLMPNCDAMMDLSDVPKIMAQVEEQKLNRGVLIFATGELYN